MGNYTSTTCDKNEKLNTSTDLNSNNSNKCNKFSIDSDKCSFSTTCSFYDSDEEIEFELKSQNKNKKLKSLFLCY